MSAFYVVAATLAFTLFDWLLFPLTVGADGEPNRWRVPYRVLQIAVQLGLYAACWILAGWACAGAAALVWWSGGCDVLYYVFDGDRSEFWTEARWYWLWWTPLGLVRRASGRRDPLMTSTEVLWQALAGAALSIPLLLI